jgi:hypothetical protein
VEHTGDLIVFASIIKPSVDKYNGNEDKVWKEWQDSVDFEITGMSPAISSSLQFVFPAGKEHKQYVNLDDNGKDEGANPTLKVCVENPVEGQNIYWKVTADANNSKRTAPKIGLRENDTAPLQELNNRVAVCTSKVKGGEATVILACGVAGGDRFEVEVGVEEGKWLNKTEIVNWRKLWYEIICPDFTELVKGKDSEGNEILDYPEVMKRRLIDKASTIFVEFQPYKTHTFTEAQAPAGSVFKSEQLGYPAGKKGYVLTDHTFKSYPKKFNKGKSPRSIHIKLCHRNFFFESSNMPLTSDTYTLTSKRYIIFVSDWYSGYFLPFSSENGADSIKSFTWRAQIDPALHPLHPGVKNGLARTGILTSADIKFNSVREIVISLPDTNPDDPGNIVGPGTTAARCPIKVEIAFECAQEGLGLAGKGAQKGELLSFYNPEAQEVSIDVLLHEIGHCVGLTVCNGKSKPSPGLDYPKTVNDIIGGKRGSVYTGKSHSGSHCAFGLTDAEKTGRSFAGLGGKCIMFGENAGIDPSGAQGFCDECQSSFRSRELESLVKDWNI